ncbi:carbohydrate binding protein [Cryptococcus neoformans]|nr:carbohydrate binding protein [Cryptococcus neoformans var. grubii]
MLLSRTIWIWLAPCLCLSNLLGVRGMTDARRIQLRDETAALFRHGYEGYIKYAYPADELRPLSCAPLRRSKNAADFGINDLHANVSLTLLDVLSSLPLLHPHALPSALERITTQVSFDQDVKVQVFEMTIRALGGLLSMYQYLDDLPDSPYEQARVLGVVRERKEGWLGLGLGAQEKVDKVDVKKYKLRILELAEDLGRRMLPAFNTKTGLPYARVNLKRGIEKGESAETCTAGAGSLILEFSLLSRLTGDHRYEQLARNAYYSIWNRRSDNNLLGNTIGATHGHWLMPGLSGVGAGMDSFFEYGVKAGIMLGDDSFYDIFYDSYAAIQTHVRTPDGFIYRPIHTRLLQIPSPTTIDSLSAFLPAIQVLAGDIPSAIRSHLVFWNLWRKFGALPESWRWQERRIEWAGWPGRPEFIESTYYLYQATKDPFYLRVGERVLKDLARRTKTSCGFATIKNVLTSELEDRMESFMLSETLKYLYLLFSDTPFPNQNKVFTTEGHPLYIPQPLLQPSTNARKSLHKGEWLMCPAYQSPFATGGIDFRGMDRIGNREEKLGITVGIEGTSEYEYARALVFGWGEEGLKVEDQKRMWFDGGVCSIQEVPKFAFDIVLTPTSNEALPEDPSPGPDKVYQNMTTGDYVISNITGIRLGVRWRLDGQGYDVSSIGPHRVRTGQQVTVIDSSMQNHFPLPSLAPGPPQPEYEPTEVILRFVFLSPVVVKDKHLEASTVFLHALGATATFGKDFGASATSPSMEDQPGWQLGGGALPILVPPNPSDGCSLLTLSTPEHPFILLLDRGNCTFAEKAQNAETIGASGLLIVGYPHPPEEGVTEGDQTIYAVPEEGLVRPSAEPNEAEGLDNMGIVYMEHLVGELVRNASQKGEIGAAIMRIEGVGEEAAGSSGFPQAGSGATKKHWTSDSRTREGRLAVGDWEICNLVVVDTSV